MAVSRRLNHTHRASFSQSLAPFTQYGWAYTRDVRATQLNFIVHKNHPSFLSCRIQKWLLRDTFLNRLTWTLLAALGTADEPHKQRGTKELLQTRLSFRPGALLHCRQRLIFHYRLLWMLSIAIFRRIFHNYESGDPQLRFHKTLIPLRVYPDR